jgi:hypothetical protein
MHRHLDMLVKSMRPRTAVAATVLMASVAALGSASPALATSGYAQFAQCPTSDPGIEICTYSTTTAGEVKLGSTAVPITGTGKTITLQGGGLPDGIAEGSFYLLPAKNGESLSKTELNVPGGLLDIINCKEIKGNGIWELIERGSCELIFENKTTGVTATTELVANEHDPAILNTGNVFEETGTALTLPVRVHLKNPLLGNSCYIGSESKPITLNLTTGATSPPEPNKSIHGKAGALSFEEEDNIVVLTGNSLVDNSFSTPEAEGCGEFFSFLIDPIVDAKIGLPSKAGHNTAILTGAVKIAESSVVAAHGY